MSKGNIVLFHRRMARDAIAEAARREAGRKPVGLSDEAIEYLIDRNPGVHVSRTASSDGLDLILKAFGFDR